MKKFTIFLILIFTSSVTFGALLAPPKDTRNSSEQLEVLPPMGFLGCEECQNPYMGGVKGPSRADLDLFKKWDNRIFGGAENQNSGADAVDGD